MTIHRVTAPKGYLLLDLTLRNLRGYLRRPASGSMREACHQRQPIHAMPIGPAALCGAFYLQYQRSSDS